MEEDYIKIPKNMLKGLENYSTEHVIAFIRDLMPAAINLLEEKDKDYGGSWQKKGLLSVHSNFERKTDRIANLFQTGNLTKEGGENVADTLIDAANYSLLYLFFLYRNNETVKNHVDEFIKEYGTKKVS